MKPFAVLLHYKNYNEPYCNIDSESDYFGLLFWNLNKKTGDSPTVSFIALTFWEMHLLLRPENTQKDLTRSHFFTINCFSVTRQTDYFFRSSLYLNVREA